VAGDDDAALACALAAIHAGVPVARLGAGLRCGDRNARREINRIAIDTLAARLYTDDDIADEQLRLEGVDDRIIRRVGSTVPAAVARSSELAIAAAAWTSLNVGRSGYVLVYLNRRESLSDPGGLAAALIRLAQRDQVVLCLGEASARGLAVGGHLEQLATAGAVISRPISYLEFLSLQAGAGAVLTDSGGVQEEASVLGVPCFTLAWSTERNATLTHGTNVLLGDDPAAIDDVTRDPRPLDVECEPLSDLDAGQRVANDLLSTRWDDVCRVLT
jgi:UDP-N-acetylglucosamine 2-epimerase (non-hydrolysing)